MMVLRRALPLFCCLACVDPGGDGGPLDAGDPTQGPQLKITPSVLVDFGRVSIGQQHIKRVTLESVGSEPVVVETLRLTSGDPTKWAVSLEDQAMAGLAPGESAELQVGIDICPEGTECTGGLTAGSIEIRSNAPPGLHSLSASARPSTDGSGLRIEPTMMMMTHAEYPHETLGRLLILNESTREITIEGISLDDPSGELYFLGGNCSFPCGVRLCPIGERTCLRASLTSSFGYYDWDPFSDTPRKIVVRTSVGTMDIDVVPQFQSCRRPHVDIVMNSTLQSRNSQVRVRGGPSRAGEGHSLDALEYFWVRTPSIEPELTPQGLDVTFTVTATGTYVIGAHAENSCGGRSQVPDVAEFDVL